MKTLGELLQRFTLKLSPQKLLILLLQEYLKLHTIPYTKLTLTLSNQTLYIQTNPNTKQYLLLHTKQVLSFLQEKAPRILLKEIK